MNESYYYVFPIVLAAQIFLLVCAVKRKNELLFLITILLGWVSAAGIHLMTQQSWEPMELDFVKALFCAIMPPLHGITSQISIAIRIAMKDKMPSKIPWLLVWWLALILGVSFEIYCWLQ